MTALDWTALAVFAVVWLFYEKLQKRLSRGARLNSDMTVVRAAWMARMAGRDMRLMDGQLLGHALNSASFFASASLIVVAACAGALFGGESAWRNLAGVPFVAQGPVGLLEAKLALVVVALVRGLLDFMWSIRQLNYCVALIGATPDQPTDATAPRVDMSEWAACIAAVLNPALSSFNAGVRGYYFALAAAAWLAGPAAFLATTVGAVSLLVWRQRSSPAAKGIHQLRLLIDGPASGKT